MKIYGFEFEANRSFLTKLNGYFNYTWQNYSPGKMDFQPEIVWYRPQLAPRNKINIGLRYRPFKNTIAMAHFRYVDIRKSVYAGKLKSFYTVNLGIETLPLIFGQKLKIKGFVDNLFKEEYQEMFGYPMPGRTFGFSIGYEF